MSEPEHSRSEQETQQFEHCEQCNAPVDREQRYCVNCGVHRRHVPDPAAKYLSRASAHTGAPVSAAHVGHGGVVSRVAGAGGGIGLFGALAIALVPVAAAVGVAIGRSSNNQDAKLIQVLERQRAQVTTTYSASASAGSSPASTGAGSSTKKTSTAKHRKASTRSTTSSTSNGTAAKIAGSKVTAAEQAQGSSEAKKVQSSTGKSYVQAGNNLPSSVVVGQ